MNLLLFALLQEAGIAAAYPGDEHLERDPRVLFVEDFESGTVPELAARWGDAAHPANMDLSPEIAPGSPGRRSLHISKNGHLYTHVKGVDRLHARFYVRFHPKTGYIHHFVHLNAQRTPSPSPSGTAGIRPPGDERFSTGIEPWGNWGKAPAPGIWHFYSYWHEMKGGRDGKYWGNFFDPAEPAAIEPGRWYCVEAMIQANSTPEAADGEQAFWIDGKAAGTFKGIRWRSHDAVKLNTFWLLYYITEQAARQNSDRATDRVDEVWFDDIVLATAYIGPVSGAPKAGKKVAVPGRSALQAPPPPPDPALKLLYAQSFESDAGPFKAERRDGALLLPPKGAEAWNAWSVPIGPATELRLKLKPLAEIGELTIQIWSDRLKDNVRQRISGLRRDETRALALPLAKLRSGWAMDGASLEGSTFNNLKIFFQGPDDARVLVDDLEIRN